MAWQCSFCGSTSGPFIEVEGLFLVLTCADRQAARGHGSGPYSVMTRAELRGRAGPAASLGRGHKAAASANLAVAPPRLPRLPRLLCRFIWFSYIRSG